MKSDSASSSQTKRKEKSTNGADERKINLSRAELMEIYHRLMYVRYFDVVLYDLKKKGRVTRGEIYSCRGQEAVIVGTTFPLRRDDYISPVHRDLPAFLMKGMSANEVMAQVFGRYTAPGKSKDVWTHFGDLRKGIIHSTSMLASTIPVAAGVAQALVMDGKDSVVVAYMGEGATARGDLHEGMNYAAVHKLPLIVVVENNQWAYSTPSAKNCPTPHFADRAKGFGIPGITVDGQNVLAVHQATSTAIDDARNGKGPTIIECVTYRLLGHASHDDTKAQQYRPKEQQDYWNNPDRDPIVIFRNFLLKNGFKQNELPAEPTEAMVNEVQSSVQYAMNSPTAPRYEALEDIYDESAGVSL